MSDFWSLLKNEDNYTYTENGAVAYKSSLNKCLDMFATFGSVRHITENDKERYSEMFVDALAEDAVMAMKVIFYIRDVRGGQGARAIFRLCMETLLSVDENMLKAVIGLIPEYGRWDDLFGLIKFRNTKVNGVILEYVAKTLATDIESNTPSLLAKWMPSETASNREQKKLAAYFANRLFKGNKRAYRTVLSTLRKRIKVVESSMSAKKWDIDFSAVPSKASLIYQNAFYKHNPEGYEKYLRDVAAGKAKINAATLFPVDIVKKVEELPYNSTKRETFVLDAMWNALPNYLEGKDETGLCVVDVSGSMSGTPMQVAVSLGLYCAERAKGPYHNKFITFSARPDLVEVRGENIVEKVRNMKRANWDMNTDIEAVFDLILDTAVRNRLPQSELPSKLYIISDMQFDQARSEYSGYWYNRRRKPNPNESTFMSIIKRKFAAAGYEMPLLVYWNVSEGKTGIFQETVGGEQCCMVSGFSPSLFKAVIEGTSFEEEIIITETGEKKVVTVQKLNPLDMMVKTLSNPRYDPVGEAMKAFS